MGRLLGDIVEKMHLKMHNSNANPKILIHGTHDTGLAALLNTLDVFDDRCAALSSIEATRLRQSQMAGLHGLHHLRTIQSDEVTANRRSTCRCYIHGDTACSRPWVSTNRAIVALPASLNRRIL